MTQLQPPRRERLAWLEGIRIFAALTLLLYHAQLLFTDYAYTPQPTGLIENWQEMTAAIGHLGSHSLVQALSLPIWFGYQFVDVFVLISGFSLVLSLKGQPLQLGSFIQQRFSRILWPFWTVAWLSYPVLWLVGTLTHSYIPDAWHIFAGLTFPLLFDYGGQLLLSTNGPWWFIPLILSFALVFPLLWHLIQRWGVRNLLGVSLGVTIAYRALATYWLNGHLTYVMVGTSAGWQPFLTFVAKLGTFVLGMIVALDYQRGRGAIYWSDRKALGVGGVTYALGFVLQFYRWGWLVNDFLISIGLTLLCMVLFRNLNRTLQADRLFIWLGSRSYSYFLIHNFVIDRTIRLWVHDRLDLYYLALPGMLLGTLGLATLTDAVTPKFRRGVLALGHQIDRRLRQPKPPIWQPNVGEWVGYCGQRDWRILQTELVAHEDPFCLCQISNGTRSLWVNAQDLQPLAAEAPRSTQFSERTQR